MEKIMAETQDNLQQATSESTAEQMTSDDFFAALDASINPLESDFVDATEGGVPAQVEAEDNSREAVEAAEETPSEPKQPRHDWKKRYEDSSKEARNLNDRLTHLEPYAPLLDAMREDPNLVNHVKGYFEGGGSTPSNLKERVGITDEDFVFDYDEAIETPNSDSGRLLNATIDGVVSQRLNEFASEQNQVNQRTSDETAFRQRHEMSDTEFNDVINFAKANTLTLDDVYYLMNKDSKAQKIAEHTREETVKQMKKARSKPRSAAASGSATSQESGKSMDDEVFEFLRDSDVGGLPELQI